MIEEKELRPTDDAIFGKVRPGMDGDLPGLDAEVAKDKALDAAHAAMFGANVTPEPTRWANDNAEYTNALGLESTKEHTRIAKVWQEKCEELPALLAAERMIAERKFDIRGFSVTRLKVQAKEKELLIDSGRVRVNRRGMETLGDFIGVPEAYISKLLDWGLGDLAAENVNQLLQRRIDRNKGEELTCTARFINGASEGEHDYLRCVASANYGILNNVDALEILAEALGDGKILASHMFNDTDRIYGNLFPEDRMVTMRGDSDYGLGIAFRNAECLQSAFAFQPFLFRAVCLNGCIWGRRDAAAMVLNQRHVGVLDKKKLVSDARTYFQAAMGQSEALLKLLAMNHDVKVKLPDAMIAHLCRANELTRDQGKAWAAAWRAEPERTGFGIVNGLTLAAQKFEGEKRVTMETLAGDLIAPDLTAGYAAIVGRWDTIDRVAAQLLKESPKIVEQYAFVGF